MLKSTFNA